MRIVLDTNVLLAGIATHGICEGLLTLSLRDHEVVISDHVLGELAEHYVGKFKATTQQADVVAGMLRQQCEVVDAGRQCPAMRSRTRTTASLQDRRCRPRRLFGDGSTNGAETWRLSRHSPSFTA